MLESIHQCQTTTTEQPEEEVTTIPLSAVVAVLSLAVACLFTGLSHEGMSLTHRLPGNH